MPFTHCMTWWRPLPLSGPHCSHLKNKDNNCGPIYIPGFLKGKSKIYIYKKIKVGGTYRKRDITLGSVTIISYCLFHILLINDEKEQGKKVWAVVESQTTFSDASEWSCGLLVLSLPSPPVHWFWCKLISSLRGGEDLRNLKRQRPCSHLVLNLNVTCWSPSPKGFLSPLTETPDLGGRQLWMSHTVKLGLQGIPPG